MNQADQIEDSGRRRDVLEYALVGCVWGVVQPVFSVATGYPRLPGLLLSFPLFGLFTYVMFVLNRRARRRSNPASTRVLLLGFGVPWLLAITLVTLALYATEG